jgi:predicted RNase H-like HicB family nuclease
MATPNKYDYSATVRYSPQDEGYVARIPAFDHCTGFGETPEAAVHEAYEGLGGILEVMEHESLPIPDADTTASRLRRLKPIIKMNHLAREAGMRPSTLASKVERGGPFTESERSRIESVLALD